MMHNPGGFGKKSIKNFCCEKVKKKSGSNGREFIPSSLPSHPTNKRHVRHFLTFRKSFYFPPPTYMYPPPFPFLLYPNPRHTQSIALPLPNLHILGPPDRHATPLIRPSLPPGITHIN